MSYAKLIKTRMKHSPLDEEDMMPVPSIYMTSKQNPEIKSWKVGETYTIKVQQISRTEEKDGEVRGTFELVKSGGGESDKD